MLVQEVLTNNLIHTYSSDGRNIKQTETGEIMQSATDANPCPYTYIETDESIPEPEPTAEEVLSILLGG